MTRGWLIAAGLAVLALLSGCSGNGPPNSSFDAAGYHVNDDRVYYWNAFPGKAFQIDGADVSSFRVLDRSYAKDASTVYLEGTPLAGADPATFELLDGELSKDAHAVYLSDGRVLSDDPAHFTILPNVDYYLFTEDARTVHVNANPIAGADPPTFRVLRGAYTQDSGSVYSFTDRIADADASSFEVLEGPFAREDARSAYWMGKAIPDADPATFRVLNTDFECTTDQRHAYYRQTVIAGADPSTFPTDRPVTDCSDTAIYFAER